MNLEQANRTARPTERAGDTPPDMALGLSGGPGKSLRGLFCRSREPQDQSIISDPGNDEFARFSGRINLRCAREILWNSLEFL